MDTDDQLKEKLHRVRSRRMLGAEASVPTKLVYATLETPHIPYIRDLYGGFIMKAWSIINLISSSSLLLRG